MGAAEIVGLFLWLVIALAFGPIELIERELCNHRNKIQFLSFTHCSGYISIIWLPNINFSKTLLVINKKDNMHSLLLCL